MQLSMDYCWATNLARAAFDLQCIGQLTMEDEQTWAL